MWKKTRVRKVKINSLGQVYDKRTEKKKIARKTILEFPGWFY